MALTTTEEAQLRALIAQQAALLSLASSESTIISKLGATKATLSALASASSLSDSDLFLVRQGSADKSATGAAIKALISTMIPSGQSPGEVAFFARSTAPSGWLKADGANVSRTTYAALFAAIGTTFGVGDGSTTFTLPDMRGEFPRGWDDGRGVDAGRAMGSWQDDAFEAHSHTISTQAGTNAGANVAQTDRGGAEFRSTSVAGGSETRPRNIALLACIKI
jgi:microcystin-dependent protein